MTDFTFATYEKLLIELIRLEYTFQTFSEFLELPSKKVVVMRHDVDRTPGNALKMAEIEHRLGVKTTYFFRSRPHVFIEDIILNINAFGHEIGYHYENLSDSKGNLDEAILSFSMSLEKFREIIPVKTICMHGRPMGKVNNQDLWKKFNFDDFGIIGEPYFSVDFNKTAYITDAGRKWNDDKVNFRDKVKSNHHLKIKNTNDIITVLYTREAPASLMINIHPHNWALSFLEWYKIFFWQSFKNIFKMIIHYTNKRK